MNDDFDFYRGLINLLAFTAGIVFVFGIVFVLWVALG